MVFKDNIRTRDVDRLAREHARYHGGRILSIYEYAPKGFAVEMPEAAAIALSHNPNVAFVEENNVFSVGAEFDTEVEPAEDPDETIFPSGGCLNAQKHRSLER
ncbi:MAG: protease inhibitor I9 family protein [Pyrinomonadaceae bacterium]